MLDAVTPLVLTYNEDPNIERTLQHLSWAKRIVVIDSYSTDRTLEILSTFSNVEVFQRQFDTHACQWNYGLEQISTEWCLSLDADYTVTEALVAEIARLDSATPIDGYFIPFQFCIFGKPLRGNNLPPRQALFRLAKSTYVDDGHTQLLQVNGLSGPLQACIYHDDRKPLSRWLWAQDRYAILEAKKLLDTPNAELGFNDRLRKLKVVAPLAVFVYSLIFKGFILDGWHGWHYTFQRTLAELVLSLRLLEQDIATKHSEK